MADYIKKVHVGNIDYDIDADKLDGNDASAFATAGHTHNFSDINSRGEAWLAWGGKNFSGNYAPIDAALNPVLSPNRLAGIAAGGVTVEYSNDGGSTWTDYGLTDVQKRSLCTTSTGIRIAGPSASCSANSQLRVTLDGINGGIYTQLWKMHIYLSTNYSSGSTVTMESYDYNSSTTWHTVIENQAISGWSGWNVLNFSLPGSGAFGGSNSAVHQRYIRLTFKNTGITSGKESSGLTIYKIYAYGGVGWSEPNNLSSIGTPYSYDYAGNASFMAAVSATSFTENGTALSSKYAGKGTATSSDGSHSHTVTVPTVSPTNTKLSTTSVVPAVSNGTASKATAGTAFNVVTGASDNVFKAAVSGTTLELTAVTFSTSSVTPYTFSDVTVAKAGTAVTVATGGTATNGSGSAVVSAVTVGSTSATTSSDGSHNHTQK